MCSKASNSSFCFVAAFVVGGGGGLALFWFCLFLLLSMFHLPTVK